VSLAGVEPGDRVIEVGAGLGSLTVALASAGARVLAVELDPRLATALAEVVSGFPSVRVEIADALTLDWPRLRRQRPWKMVSNLPYNIATPLILQMLERAPVDHYLVMVQREVGERLVAAAGEESYGAVSVKVAYRADARLVRRVPASVFWPAPRVESLLVELVPRPAPVRLSAEELFPVIEEAFAERRKTMANALRRLGLDAHAAALLLARCGLDPRVRGERLSLQEFAQVTEELRS
jgi:16S rRNA (adenine1518-N6/adenine1519-N6)-dimethyltransferase